MEYTTFKVLTEDETYWWWGIFINRRRTPLRYVYIEPDEHLRDFPSQRVHGNKEHHGLLDVNIMKKMSKAIFRDDSFLDFLTENNHNGDFDIDFALLWFRFIFRPENRRKIGILHQKTKDLSKNHF